MQIKKRQATPTNLNRYAVMATWGEDNLRGGVPVRTQLQAGIQEVCVLTPAPAKYTRLCYKRCYNSNGDTTLDEIVNC